MTLVYARIADRTVADEYFAVTEKVEALYDQPRQLPADAEGTKMELQSASTPIGLQTASTAADTNQRSRPQAGPSSTAADPADGTRRPHSPQRPDTVTIVGHREAGSRTLTAARASC
jgi:hypothetical protein